MSKVFQVNQTIDKMVKDKFLAIYNEMKKVAETKYRNDVSPVLKNYPPFERIQYLKTLIDGTIANQEIIPINAYLKAADNEDFLLKIFASRCALLNVDDEDVLAKSIFFTHFKQLLSNDLLKVKDELKEYSFEDFEKGVIDEVYLKLNYTWHLKDDEDYDRIRTWQTNKMHMILSYESKQVIEGIQNRLSQNSDFHSILSSDVSVFENLVSRGKLKEVSDIINQLSKLSFFDGYDSNLLNDIHTLNDLNHFLNRDVIWNRITPLSVDAARSRMETLPKNHLFSFPPILFFSIEQIINWMKAVLNGLPLDQEFLYPDYNSIVNQILNEIEAFEDAAFQKVNNSLKQKFKNTEDRVAEFVKILNTIRIDMNQLDEVEKQYFATIHRNDFENVFRINAIVFGLEDHSQAFKKAAEMYFKYLNYVSEYSNLSGKNNVVFDSINNDANPSEIFYIASTMVVDNDLQDRLSNVYQDALKDITAFAFPIDFVFQTMKEEVHSIFLECLDNLQSYLEDCEPGNKVLYIQSRLKELRHRELKLNSLSKLNNEQVDYGYTTLLKEYLEIEAEYITSTKDVHFFDALPEKPKKKSISAKKELHTFGYKYEDAQKLLNFVTQLTLKIDFLNTHKTSPQNLVDVFMAADLSIHLPEIHLACETTQLSYIFDKLRPYFKNLTLKNIEESQLFFTKKGTHLKAQNLSASKIDNPKEQEDIDKAFSLLQ